GMSNTVMAGEIVLVPESADNRGEYYTRSGIGTLFSTQEPPDSLDYISAFGCVSAPYAPCQRRYGGYNFHVRSRHHNAVHVLLADGAVRSVTKQIDSTIFQSLGSRNGGEVSGEW
ncbi:MAG TPA: DUF1559 domain-containing protein, partial [Planctomycetaceae bacterium]|nr:DUF1559 domain-containing protein [Planctomycetaceae bacterium]